MIRSILLLLCTLVFLSCSEHESAISNENDNMDSDAELALRHTYYDNPYIDLCDATSTTIYIEDCFNDQDAFIMDAINESIDEWNSIPNTSVYLEIVQNSEDADIIIDCIDEECDENGGILLGDATTLYNFSPNPHIAININTSAILECCPELGPEDLFCAIKRTTMHEIGHGLGFYHTLGGSQSGISQINGTPEVDIESIMTSGGCELNKNCEFSDSDIAAFQKIFAPYICECWDSSGNNYPIDCKEKCPEGYEKQCYSSAPL